MPVQLFLRDLVACGVITPGEAERLRVTLPCPECGTPHMRDVEPLSDEHISDIAARVGEAFPDGGDIEVDISH
jgi:hypothetical protein